MKHLIIHILYGFIYFSSANVPGNPIRGDMSAPPPLTRSTVVSPSISVSTVWQNQRRMIFVRSNIKGNTGHWPIPESFWPDPSLAKLVSFSHNFYDTALNTVISPNFLAWFPQSLGLAAQNTAKAVPLHKISQVKIRYFKQC